MAKPRKYTSEKDALKKLMKYCAYQDRCHREVIGKLLELGIFGEVQDNIVLTLIQEDFLNEERFAKSFARGKFRFKHWGRKKIIRELKRRDISPFLIQKALEEIDPDAYKQTLYQLTIKHLGKNPDFRQRAKTFRYLYNKGFESNLIQHTLQQILDYP